MIPQQKCHDACATFFSTNIALFFAIREGGLLAKVRVIFRIQHFMKINIIKCHLVKKIVITNFMTLQNT